MGVSPRGKSSLVVAAAIAKVFLVVDGAASKVSRNKISPLSQKQFHLNPSLPMAA